ncbi:protein IRON-RELATED TRANSCRIPTION FACTOR 2-like [Musa acuminata AAA Group]|uniref:protein IRON-RELATED TRANSCRIPTION FACTOR 2-like n=1 Tax=Musa acuminata AAA Group TaxID=214697 RepID=UPI0031DCB4CA
MVALYSPHHIFPMGWQPEDITAHDLHYEDPFACYPYMEELEIGHDDLLRHCSVLAAKDDSSSSTKKLCHNAYERDRRKKLNDLYSSLRDLLPESDQARKKKKKLSIPLIVCRVLKYVPELQRQVERLSRRKEEILLALSRPEEQSQCVRSAVQYPMVSATCLSKREVMVQLCVVNKDATFSFSKILKVLEREGLHLMNSSNYTTCDGRCVCSLHLQAREDFRSECRIFCEHLMEEVKEQARHGSNLPRSLWM